MSGAASLIFRGCPNIDENMGACAGHLIFEVIEIALIVIAATNVLGLPPLGMGLFTGFSAFALLITCVSCCCWRRQTANERGTQALFNRAYKSYMLLRYVNNEIDRLKCMIEIRYKNGSPPIIKEEVYHDRSSAKLHLQKFMDEMKKSPLDMNQLECVSFTLLGKQRGEDDYWIARFTLVWDPSISEVLDGENPRPLANVTPDDQRTFTAEFRRVGITNTAPQLDANGNFILSQ